MEKIPKFVKIVIIKKKDNKYKQSKGYCLTYYNENEKYAITNISHCSCNGSGIGKILNSADTHDLTYEQVYNLAKTKGDPRVPDAPMDIFEDQLYKLYEYILSKKNEEELLNDACVHRYCSDDESDNDSDNNSDNDSDNVSEHKTVINVYDYLIKKGYRDAAELNKHY
jgi:hypothetical protein